MTLENLLLIGFILAMLANAIAFVRHWRMMKAFEIALNGWTQTNNEFLDLMEREKRKENSSV